MATVLFVGLAMLKMITPDEPTYEVARPGGIPGPMLRAQTAHCSVTYVTILLSRPSLPPGFTVRLRLIGSGVEHVIPNSPAFATFQARSPCISHDLALAALDQRAQVVMPQRQRGAHFALIAGPIVDARDAALVPADVVQDGLDHMRRNADVGHLGRYGAAQV